MTGARLALRAALAAAAREAAGAGESRPAIAADLRHLAMLYAIGFEGELSPNTAQAAEAIIRLGHADGIARGEHDHGDACLEIADRLHTHGERLYARMTGEPPEPGWCWRGHDVTSDMTTCPECGARLAWHHRDIFPDPDRQETAP